MIVTIVIVAAIFIYVILPGSAFFGGESGYYGWTSHCAPVGIYWSQKSTLGPWEKP